MTTTYETKIYCSNCGRKFSARSNYDQHKPACIPSKLKTTTAPCTCFTGNAVPTEDGPAYQYGLCDQHERNAW
jgi:hypothetical protein